MITVRIRSIVWFAVGMAVALVAVAVFAGVRTRAAGTAVSATYVPITPCRLVDTRPQPDFNVGPRNRPIGAGESHLQQVTGTNGNCVIPSDAIAVSMNVTAAAPTEKSFMTLYPADQPLPDASNLNYLARQAPVPNKVDVALSPTGAIKVFNLNGQVHLIADVAGYYTTSALANLQAQLNAKAASSNVYTKAQVDALLSAKSDKPSGNQTAFVPASAFAIARDAVEDLSFSDDYGLWTANGAAGDGRCLVAPLDLPAGAVVTDVAAGFYIDGGGIGTMRLLSVTRVSANTTTVHAIVTANDAEGLGAGEFSAPSVNAPTVSADRSLSLVTCLSDTNADFEYARIAYTLANLP